MERDPKTESLLPNLAPGQELLATSEELEARTETSQAVPGTLNIEILNESGMPVLSPLPSSNDALILDNNSGGQMGVTAPTSAGTISIIVPDGGTVALVPRSSGVKAAVKVTVMVRKRIKVGPVRYWITVPKQLFSGGDGDASVANPYPANGRFGIDLNGGLS